ncbi:efflux RND transporter periplasmic adaptor subunit [Photobacterium chitinilyticum]|uniref:Efflux RND transporter periplasmic adaptor subunit n=1 Tax=Photobacterium chitinilyticum TaxID=2485123 RepID=A0A3S3QPW6_9GAMM|nr:efflux RND transporter periplasmic adaptor subunit [Photobacterium chitinilyticum]RWX55629.1 efflux RND transporter periplasmic adaptor subunit [Photobacterium chitinilyticum]
MKKRWIAMSLTAVCLAGVGYYSYPVSETDGSLPVIMATTGTIEKQAVAVGQIVPAHSVQIKSQIEGIVGEIYHQEGEKIEIGTPLFKIRPNPTPARLTQAMTELMSSEAELESSQIQRDNLKRLVVQEIVPENYGQYIEAKAKVKRAIADLQQKQQNLDLIRSGESSVGASKLTSTIFAPISGTILNLKVEVGEPIISTESSQSATEMMSLADMNDMIFKGSVSEHDAAQLHVGMPVTMTLAPYSEQELTGILQKVAVQSEKLNATSSNNNQSFDNGFEVEVGDIQFPEGITIRSGFSATAKITLKKAESVTTIPERALQFEGETPEVLVADESEQGFHTKPVKLGLSDGINVEVLSGLNDGDEIVDSSMMGAPNA